MRPRFRADADFNQKIVVGLRRREPSVDFLRGEMFIPLQEGTGKICDNSSSRGVYRRVDNLAGTHGRKAYARPRS